MFDVPPPFLARGLDVYMETWRVFYESRAKGITFYLDQIVVTVGDDVAFATAVGTCGYVEHGKKTDLKFRLTMGFKKERAVGSSFANTIPYRRNAEAWIGTHIWDELDVRTGIE